MENPVQGNRPKVRPDGLQAVHDCCKRKFFKNRQTKKNSDQPMSDIQELYMLQGSFKKWINNNGETVVAYSLENRSLEEKLQRSCLMSSPNSDKAEYRRGPTAKRSPCHYMFLDSNGRILKAPGRPNDKITMMSGPRPLTIRKKMEMLEKNKIRELKLAEKAKKNLENGMNSESSTRPKLGHSLQINP